MKIKALRSILALLVVISLFASTGSAQALPGTQWATGIKIQNLDASGEATLYVELYLPGGGTPSTSISTDRSGQPLKAAAGKSVELYLPDFSFSSGTYSAVVSSNVEVSAVVTNTNYAYGLADSYNAMTPSQSIAVPYVYHSHNNWSTEIFIQNTSLTTDATVEVNLSEPNTSQSAADGVANRIVPLTIPAGGTTSVDTSTAPYGTGGAYDLGWFIGSAQVRSTNSVDLAVAVNQTRLVSPSDYPGNVMISGRGLTSADAGNQILLPSLYKEYGGVSGIWRSGIKVQNQGTGTGHITITFQADNGMDFTPNTRTLDVDAGSNVEVYLGTAVMDDGTTSIPNQWRGYAIIEVEDLNPDGNPGTTPSVVATVQHTNYLGGSGYGVAMGYAGFSTGSTQVSLPTLYNWPSGAGVWVSGVKIQNMDATNPVTIEVEFSPDPDSRDMTSGKRVNLVLNPLQAKELYFGDAVIGSGDAPTTKLPLNWKGSAVVRVTAGTGTVVATVINTNYGRHVANMYTGVPIP